MNPMRLPLLAALLFAACGDDHPAGTHTHADGTVHKDEPASKLDERGHVHTERIALGEVKVGEHAISVFQVAKIQPGKEGDFDLDFATGKALPGTVRGWIGDESGRGSMKARFAKETDSRMHGHPEVPMPIPEGSKFWVEIETAAGTSKGSVSFRP